MRAGALATFLSLAGVTACSGDRATPTSTSTTAPSAVATSLGGTTVARVGDIPIDRSLVLAVARARKISAEDALSQVINDVLLARSAAANGAERDDAVSLRTSSVLARAVFAKLAADFATASFTDEEIASVIGERWLELDHPELRRVSHALVSKDVPNARAVAEQLRTTLLAANGPTASESETAFTRAAKEFKVGSGPAVHVEALRIAEDGRLAEQGPPGAVEQPFAKAAFSIADTLGTSDIVQTSYGFHVLRLLERTPAFRAPREQLIEKLANDLVALRVKPAHDQLLDKLRAATKIEIVATDALLALPR